MFDDDGVADEDLLLIEDSSATNAPLSDDLAWAVEPDEEWYRMVSEMSPGNDRDIDQMDGGRSQRSFSGGSSDEAVIKKEPHVTESNPPASSQKRVRRRINGVDVILPPTLTEADILKLSSSQVVIESIPSPEPRKKSKHQAGSSSKPPVGVLSGREKTEFLLGMCQPVVVSVDRLQEPDEANDTDTTVEIGCEIPEESETELESVHSHRNEQVPNPPQSHEEREFVPIPDSPRLSIPDDDGSGSIFSINDWSVGSVDSSFYRSSPIGFPTGSQESGSSLPKHSTPNRPGVRKISRSPINSLNLSQIPGPSTLVSDPGRIALSHQTTSLVQKSES